MSILGVSGKSAQRVKHKVLARAGGGYLGLQGICESVDFISECSVEFRVASLSNVQKKVFF